MQRSLLSHYQPDTGEPHAAAQYQCIERDGGVCVLTGTSNPKPYSIVPFAWVQSMAVIKKSTVVLPVPSTLFDEPRRLNAVWNMLSLDPRLHNYWCRGCFAFKFITAWPIMNGAGESIVMLEFHWMPQFKTKPMAPVVLEGQINDLETIVYEVEAFDKVEVPVSHLEAGSSLTSGRRLRLRMKTEDSVLFREMIELQWVCIVIASLCGATGSLDLLPDFEGFEDTSAAERLFAWIQDQAKWTKERMESAELDEEMLDAMRKLEGQLLWKDQDLAAAGGTKFACCPCFAGLDSPANFIHSLTQARNMGPNDFELHSVRTVTNDFTVQQGLAKDQQVLRYRRRSLWIFAFYLPLLILPWIFTCVLMFRPLNVPSYTEQRPKYTSKDVGDMERWRAAVDALTRIAGTLGIPIVSALLAHGAVVYTQRSKPDQKLSVLQLFTLADREWLNVPFLLKALTKPRLSAASVYFWLAAVLIIITDHHIQAAIQPPLQSILIRDRSIPIVTCKGHPGAQSDFWRRDSVPKECRDWGRDTWLVGRDPDPTNLAFTPRNLVVERTREKIISTSDGDTQMYMWSDSPYWPDDDDDDSLREPDENTMSFAWYNPENYDAAVIGKRSFFVSSFPNGTSTGVYRYHAARMDSDTTCTKVKTFPADCKGEMPFSASFSHPELNIDVCAEGDSETVPWAMNRNKQDVKETLWLRMTSNVYLMNLDNYTLRCDSISRRGWFELPNLRNGHVAGPLLDVWPSQKVLDRDFNDGIDYLAEPNSTAEVQYWPDNDGGGILDAFSTRQLLTPGPLMTAALAMFGNTSFFYAASQAPEDSRNETMRQICEQVQLPFVRMFQRSTQFMGSICDNVGDSDADVRVYVENTLARYFEVFGIDNNFARALNAAMYFANEALLTLSTERAIYSHAGHQILKPEKRIAPLIFISVLIGLQAIGLCLLMAFINSAPTWTQDLDADALTQIGAQLREWGEPRPSLTDLSGLIGVDETRRDAESSSVRMSSIDAAAPRPRIHLALGGEGIIPTKMPKTTTTVETTH
ncbi:hypothetical protein NM208_g5864 [Fusarium decemcellulare]|uniref:Uncharacterized protein n=1 Tax=Fusarium decemcellulare TaxID=57161 RepID=A0ACC1SF95_9HYPO|nr:hypothetical protein NM208_g5864 [Fusarium decemcellulare]